MSLRFSLSVLVLPALFSTPAKADLETNRLWINAGFYSQHFDTGRGLRNANPGLGVEYWLNENWSATFGRFINSDNAQSNFIGAYYQPWRLRAWKLGVVGGAFNGYPRAFNGNWFPAVLPVASIESGHVGLNIVIVPPLKDRLYGSVSMQLKVRF